MNNLISFLQNRGFIEATNHPKLDTVIQEKGKVKVYCGFDPTAESLHVGNLVALMGLSWFRKAGHDVIALIGGATGMIGDPSGKSHERQLLDEATLSKNVAKITKQITDILSRVPGNGTIEIVNNRDWYQGMSCIDFLRDIGKQFRVGVMLSKDSVKARLQSEEGMSYTEFSYQLLQGYDFYHLFSQKNTLIQIGGSDQWGNITAGTDYIRKVRAQEAYGVTFSLLVKSDGQKFGKSEKGALWLSSEMLSEYDLYQYLYRVADSDVIRLIKMLTFVDIEEINALEASMALSGYIPNTVQKRLAEEVVRFIHGEDGLTKAIKATLALMPGHNQEYTKETVESMIESLQPILLTKDQVIGHKAVDVVVLSGLIASKSEARRLIKNQGVALNGEKIPSEDFSVQEKDLVDGQYLVVNVGKKQKSILKLL